MPSICCCSLWCLIYPSLDLFFVVLLTNFAYLSVSPAFCIPCLMKYMYCHLLFLYTCAIVILNKQGWMLDTSRHGVYSAHWVAFLSFLMQSYLTVCNPRPHRYSPMTPSFEVDETSRPFRAHSVHPILPCSSVLSTDTGGTSLSSSLYSFGLSTMSGLYFIPDMMLHWIQHSQTASSIDSTQQYDYPLPQSSFSQFHAKGEISDLQWEIIHLQHCNTELEQTNGHLEWSNIKLEVQCSMFQ